MLRPHSADRLAQTVRALATRLVFGATLIGAIVCPAIGLAQVTPLPAVAYQANPQSALAQPLYSDNAAFAPELARPNSWRPPPMGPPCVPDDYDACAWRSQVLPHGIIYQSYMAGTKEPRFASFWADEDDLGTVWDTALGGRAGLWRYGNDNPDWPEGWQVDLEGAVFPRLDPFGESTPLISSDYRVGIPVTYGGQQWQFKVGYFHISSHLGDEFMLDNPGVERINYVRDGIVLGAGYFYSPEFRLYGEIDYALGVSGGAQPLELQFGFEWAQARNTGLRGGPFLAFNGSLREEVDFGGNVVVQFGWMWRRYVRGSNFRIGGQYFYGKSDQFEFFETVESRLGWGIWYDF